MSRSAGTAPESRVNAGGQDAPSGCMGVVGPSVADPVALRQGAVQQDVVGVGLLLHFGRIGHPFPTGPRQD